ncbi:MAG: cytochrome c oxidase accessory protein CcoG [Brachymonas sp.]
MAMSNIPRKKIIPIAQVDGEGRYLFQSEDKVYARSVKGIFNSWRWVFVWLTQIAFYVTPWLNWGGRQAVLFDLDARRFYIFGLVLYPQDFVFLAALLIISAYSLFLFTAVAGRLWCGYTCPQTVYTEIFMFWERLIEGDRLKRMKLDAGHSFERYWRKGLKHLVWILIALWTGLTFVGFFVPIRAFTVELFTFAASGWALFWTLFYGFATYGNAGFMREQVCKYMCPYARFQGAMFDKDTLIVTYDTARGEPRGSRGKNVDYKAQGLGDCINCTMCVQVCPTGIDIRDGLQMECIACGACIDACDDVMEKVGYAPGLIKYTTEHAVERNWGRAEVLRRALRPRILIYTAIWSALIIAFFVSLGLRSDFKVNVVRDRATLARIVDGGQIENVYRIQVMNTTEREQHYSLSAQGLPQLQMHGEVSATLKPAEARWLVVQLRMPYGAEKKSGSHKVEVLTTNDAGQTVREKAVFYIPR